MIYPPCRECEVGGPGLEITSSDSKHKAYSFPPCHFEVTEHIFNYCNIGVTNPILLELSSKLNTFHKKTLDFKLTRNLQ